MPEPSIDIENELETFFVHNKVVHFRVEQPKDAGSDRAKRWQKGYLTLTHFKFQPHLGGDNDLEIVYDTFRSNKRVQVLAAKKWEGHVLSESS